jgi:hypothetical protein
MKSKKPSKQKKQTRHDNGKGPGFAPIEIQHDLGASVKDGNKHGGT